MKSPGRVAVEIGGLEIMWYGILISAAIICATLIIMRRAKSHGIEPDRILDFALVVIPSAIIGTRLYYVLFNWDYYSQNLLQIFNLREGGLAIHGGLIFGITAGFILCRRWDINLLNGLDLAMPAVALGQSIGRWGNFFNEEAYGSPTDLPWALDIDGAMVHPTFLYESIWMLILFFFLSYVDKHRKFTGQVFLLYCILYSFERFFVEGLRTDSLMLGSFRVAQIVSAVLFFAGIGAYAYLKSREKKRTDWTV